MIGENIGDRYTITALLGKQRGRRTFLATDSETNLQVVLKLILFDVDFSWQDLKLFEREAATLKSLDHPAIPQYVDSFEAETSIGNGFVLVQSYIEAKSLQQWVSSGYRFKERDLKAIAFNLLNILIYLHNQKPPVIHRDIKPSNILLLGNKPTAGSIYLVDFDAVQTVATTGTMTIVGTYGYMPPEQFGGRAVPASDLFSLGMTLVYLITGAHPADLAQQNKPINDALLGRLTPGFKRWIRLITQSDLNKRIASADESLQMLKAPDKQSSLSNHTSLVNHEPSEAGLLFHSAHNDFRAFCNEKTLEIQCVPDRILGNRDFRLPPKHLYDKVDILHVIGAGTVSLAWATSLISMTGVLIAIIFAFMLSTGFTPLSVLFSTTLATIALGIIAKRTKRQIKKPVRRYQIANINIKELEPDLLSLSVFVDTYQGKLKQRSMLCSNLPILSIKTDWSKTTVRFICIEHRGERPIYVKGDKNDVRWIFSILEQWKLTYKRDVNSGERL